MGTVLVAYQQMVGFKYMKDINEIKLGLGVKRLSWGLVPRPKFSYFIFRTG